MKGIEMNKTTPTTDSNIWDDVPAEKPTKKKAIASTAGPDEFDSGGFDTDGFVSRDFDLEGLMTDFPTARDLERFVFDETGVVLNLKGRANKLKYQIAMDALWLWGSQSSIHQCHIPFLHAQQLEVLWA